VRKRFADLGELQCGPDATLPSMVATVRGIVPLVPRNGRLTDTQTRCEIGYRLQLFSSSPNGRGG
jgi:hypothetical protein